MVNIGDKVKVKYISDCNPHNNEIGEVIDTRTHKYYPNGNPNEFIFQQCCTIEYKDGTTEYIIDTDRKGSGLVSPLEKIAQ